MTNTVNRQVTMASRPDGFPSEDNFRIVETEAPAPQRGQVLVRTLWLSLDPYMRGRMNPGPSYAAPVEPGGVMQGEVVGRVEKSESEKFKPGDIVRAHLGWQEFGVVEAGDAYRVDPSLGPVSTAVGVLGMPGLTAYFGLFRVGRPEAGDTVVVSAASGAVGAVVGQLAKIAGCRAVGIAGSDEKVGYVVDELGFDVGINYRAQNVGAALGDACPDGVDVYFDNVGGAVSDAVLDHLAVGARVSLCGQISQYNVPEQEPDGRTLRKIHAKRATAQGFLVYQFAQQWEDARRRLARWVNSGRLKYREDVVDGLENAPRAFIGMLRGENFGKLLVRVSEE
ncbi:MAG: NADP-dependent oxidoreductase [Chloroflexota bacterium]